MLRFVLAAHNIRLLPTTPNWAKSDKIGERQLTLAKRFHDAGLLLDAEFMGVQARFHPIGTEEY